MKRKLRLWGWPLGHSLSPLMQGIALDLLGLEWGYVAEPVKPEGLKEAVSQFRRDPACWGANVTIPHKQAIMEHLDEISPLARQIGAVNTVTRLPGGGLRGENTDVGGLAQSIQAKGLDPGGLRGVILGAGGAARASARVLSDLGIAEITLFARRPPGSTWWENLLERRARPSTSIRSWNQICAYLKEQGPEDRQVIINATPVGMWPEISASPLDPGQLSLVPRGSWVVDLVYRPRMTRLVTEARSLGFNTLTGEGMLVGQGALSLEMWIQKPLSPEVVEAMCQAVRKELEGSSC